MARKIRLNQEKREALKNHARQALICRVEEEAEIEAHAAAFKAITDTLAKLPVAEIAVLRKYGHMHSATAAFASEDQDIPEFCFCLRDWRRPPVRDRYCHRRRNDCDVRLGIPAAVSGFFGLSAQGLNLVKLGKYVSVTAAQEAIFAYHRAREAHDAAREEALKDVFALIEGARYLEDITESWPAAEEFRVEFGGFRKVNAALKERVSALESRKG